MILQGAQVYRNRGLNPAATARIIRGITSPAHLASAQAREVRAVLAKSPYEHLVSIGRLTCFEKIYDGFSGYDRFVRLLDETDPGLAACTLNALGSSNDSPVLEFMQASALLDPKVKDCLANIGSMWKIIADHDVQNQLTGLMGYAEYNVGRTVASINPTDFGADQLRVDSPLDFWMKTAICASSINLALSRFRANEIHFFRFLYTLTLSAKNIMRYLNFDRSSVVDESKEQRQRAYIEQSVERLLLYTGLYRLYSPEEICLFYAMQTHQSDYIDRAADMLTNKRIDPQQALYDMLQRVLVRDKATSGLEGQDIFSEFLLQLKQTADGSVLVDNLTEEFSDEPVLASMFKKSGLLITTTADVIDSISRVGSNKGLFRGFLEVLSRRLGQLTCIDIGSGPTGDFAKDLIRSNEGMIKSVTSIDNGYIDAAAKFKGEVISADITNASDREKAGIVPESFELVTINNIDNPDLIPHALPLLKPDGVLIITFAESDLQTDAIEIVRHSKELVGRLSEQDPGYKYTCIDTERMTNYPLSNQLYDRSTNTMLVVIKEKK
ncbi:MAG: hypothetical protein WC527_03255 [Candidatus Margulisiibacteriota bacterium]